ncbi:MAG: MaoC family dehydratase [Rhodospirillaceae bacterium]|jgi:acyl dehydratase|nr:MaoC family dehydratase [Rhodospirillaceae bacterium]MBT3810942.1 MaoC family dehydratase [Rhodospirillaceae bacterium]MBT4772005.1 MaoC family dehydratase [Rhodospirillaceae bacterium]MBT6311077.1 MaoC family dehydratase [Rhodospirillaceae bacterium]MBT7366249.1 MaoC family dehydratase [Rhodospirillaceae bacterium]
MSLLHLDDFETGQVYDLGQHMFAEDEIIEFATQFDPQPFHVDPEAAAASNFDGLIASGWHTGSVFMRLLVDGLLARCASMGSPGVDELRWLAPVRPGDVLTATLHIEEVRPSKSRPDRGFITTRAVLTNQDAAEVFTLRAPLMIRRRAEPAG